MPPENAPNGSSQQAAARKRSLAGANRVAIPLPLSRPRPAKTQPKPNVDAAVEALAKRAVEQDVKVESEKSAPTVEKVDNVDKATPTSNTPAAETPVSRGSTAMSVSDGPTPEPKTVRQPTPPPAAAAPPKPATQAHAARKPSQIRTELPPAFVPSAAQHTPQSSLHMNRNSQVFQPQAHPSRPSAGSIVFGGEDSSTSSPAPPQSAGSNFIPPSTFPVQRQPPPFVPTSHAHHFSEPQPYANYSPGYPPPFPGQRPMFAAQPPHFQQHSHANFRYPSREPFVPSEAPQPNGHVSASRSESPSSTNAAQGMRSPTAGDRPSEGQAMTFPEPKAAFPGPPGYRQQQFGRQMPPQQGSPDFRSELDNAQVLRDHVRNHFASPLLADCHLQITLESDASKQYIDAHKLILARSPTLLSLIQSSAEPSSASLKTQVHILLKDSHISLRSFSDSLKFLYGGPLLQFSQPQPSPTEMAATNEDRMHHALSHIASGVYLRIPEVAMRGVAVATSYIHWDTLPAALAFALSGGLSPVWTPDDGSEDRHSTSSSEDSLAPPASATGVPTYDPHATQLLHAAFHFVATMFPPNFYPDTSAPELSSCPRLPTLPTSVTNSTNASCRSYSKAKKLSTSDPRLGGLRFGELPAANDPPARPSQIATMISSLLFSLPFALFKLLLEHPILADRLGAETVGSIMRQVVVERESRRVRAVKARAGIEGDAQGTGKNEGVLEGNLGWEEIVDVCGQGRLGLRIKRRWRGRDTPGSSADGRES